MPEYGEWVPHEVTVAKHNVPNHEEHVGWTIILEINRGTRQFRSLEAHHRYRNGRRERDSYVGAGREGAIPQEPISPRSLGTWTGVFEQAAYLASLRTMPGEVTNADPYAGPGSDYAAYYVELADRLDSSRG